MKKIGWIKKNSKEEGFVLVYAIIILMVLTLLGIMTTTNTSTELRIAGNYKNIQEIFYLAEAAATEGVVRIAAEEDSKELTAALSSNHWLVDASDDRENDVNYTNYVDYDQVGNIWENAGNNSTQESQIAEGDEIARYSGCYWGIIDGDSLKWDNGGGQDGNVRTFVVVAYSSKGNGRKIVQMGYRKRYEHE